MTRPLIAGTSVRSLNRRPVRVTIEGEAYSPDATNSVVIVVRQDGGKVCLPADAPGVTVENIEPPRVWTDGDVVQHVTDNRVWRRVKTEAGHRWTNGFMGLLVDTTVSVRVDRGELRVLRYQHGGDA